MRIKNKSSRSHFHFLVRSVVSLVLPHCCRSLATGDPALVAATMQLGTGAAGGGGGGGGGGEGGGGGGAGGPAEAPSRRELHDEYARCQRESRAEGRPCRDARLLDRVARYLATGRPAAASAATFTVFPFYRAVAEGRGAGGCQAERRRHLSAVAKAAELLETVCVNLFLQPWKKEFRTLKTFTGPFVYCLLPALSSSTIQSVLASIGYLPHADAPPSEFRLREDADPDRAILVGFELLLARVECLHLLEILEKDQLGPQEWLEVLRRRAGPTKLDEPAEKKTTAAEKEAEEEEEEEKKEEDGADRKELPVYSDTRRAAKPQAKPRHCRLTSADQSIMEMQRTYPDLAFRGRPLLPDKPHRAKSGSKAVHPAGDNHGGDGRAAEIPRRNCVKGAKAPPATIGSKHGGRKGDDALADGGRSGACKDTAPHDTDGGRGDEGLLSGPPAISLRVALKTPGSEVQAEQTPRPGQCQATAEPSGWAQQQAAAENQRPTTRELPSLSSVDEEERDLRELAERMQELNVRETTKEEVPRKAENTSGENANKERRRKGRRTSAEGEAAEEELNLWKPAAEKGAAPSRDAARCSRSSQADTASTKQQQPSALSGADAQGCSGGGGGGTRRQPEGEDTATGRGRGEEEQLAQGFVIVDHQKK
uniref:Spermatogenesis-associated protein 2 PUB-like domain-containing protein n=1 Tax=Scophthalmus maximus TaxID=52904 RepID=A0A8D3BA29_SCOMX